MKLRPFLILIIACFTFTGCMKATLDANSKLNNDDNIDLSSFPLSNADSYQPISKNSTWNYTITINGPTALSTNKMTGDRTIFNNMIYYNVSGSYSSGSTALSYYYSSGHVYRWRNTILMQGAVTDIPYLIDTVSAGKHWLSKINDTGTINGQEAQLAMTMVERNISKTVNSKLYNSVMHTTVEIQFKNAGIYQTTTTYDFYLAKGVGIIEMDQTDRGTIVARHQLTSYSLN